VTHSDGRSGIVRRVFDPGATVPLRYFVEVEGEADALWRFDTWKADDCEGRI
jgi:hypothetical protein